MTKPNDALRNRYLTDAVATASPAKLLVMLYDRLLLDLARGEQALRDGDRPAAHGQLLHAQDIVAELLSSLKVDDWAGGPGLAQLYSFLLNELIQANTRHEPDRVANCKALVEPLRDAWREAATAATATAA